MGLAGYSISRKQDPILKLFLMTSSASCTQLLSLLRALLRETTYLPDASSRVYLKQHILAKYRANQSDALLHGPPTKCDNDRLRTANRKARKAFTHLKKANEGHLDYLEKVLLMTYGRTGERRFKLLEPVLRHHPTSVKAEAPAGTKSFNHAKLQARFPHLQPKTLSAIPQMTPAFEALLKSQVDTRPAGAPKSTPKSLKMDIAELNVWMLPMPERRIKNKAKKWYNDMVKRVLPPLPADEWHRLRRLAQGSDVPACVRGRRSMQHLQGTAPRSRGPTTTGGLSADLDCSNKLLQQLGLEPEVSSYAPATPLQKSPGRFTKYTRPHTVTPRLMRHLYQKIFRMCPTMLKVDGEKEEYTISWGTSEPTRDIARTQQIREDNKSMLSLLVSSLDRATVNDNSNSNHA